MARTLILGLGNPFRGDDGLGPAIVTTLEGLDLPWDSVEILDGGTPGLDTILMWQGYQRLIIVDAADMGLAAGEWRRFDLENLNLTVNDNVWRGTLHAAGLAEAFSLAEALNALPPETVLFVVQPEKIGWSPGLSWKVRRTVPLVAWEILKELDVDRNWSEPPLEKESNYPANR